MCRSPYCWSLREKYDWFLWSTGGKKGQKKAVIDGHGGGKSAECWWSGGEKLLTIDGQQEGKKPASVVVGVNHVWRWWLTAGKNSQSG